MLKSKEKPLEKFQSVEVRNVGTEHTINDRWLHNLNLVKELTATSNEVFVYLGQKDRIIEPRELEKLTEVQLEQLIKNIIQQTNVILT